MEAGGVGIRWEGCGSDIGPVGTDRARFGRSVVSREGGYANFWWEICTKMGRKRAERSRVVAEGGWDSRGIVGVWCVGDLWCGIALTDVYGCPEVVDCLC